MEKNSKRIYRIFKKLNLSNQLYISVSLENESAKNMFKNCGFVEEKEIEYEFLGRKYKETQMVINV